MKVRRAVVVIGLLVTCAGCKDSEGPTDNVVPCTETVAITVSPGTTPTFSWTPLCLIDELLIEPTASGIGDRWSFEGSAKPPIQYGELPPGAQLGRSPEPLVQGNQYRIVLRHSGASPFVAVQTFTP
jgi:hypothetical protein